MESKIAVRLARVADVKSLMKLSQAVYGVELMEELVLWKLKNNQELVIVAEFENELIGFACAHVKMSFCRDELLGEVTELYVEKAYRQKSVAKSMLLLLESYFKNHLVTKVTGLTVNEHEPCQYVFESLGYEKSDYCVYEKQICKI
ncbi:MAG TPA: hypothetical protein DCY20_11465 [Firmicutes bacterium]|nr:hypothetical protein [Bacillota bacterium]